MSGPMGVVHNGVVTAGPHDWKRDPQSRKLVPGLGAEATEKVYRTRAARLGMQVPLEDAPSTKELKEKAKALSVAERELAKERAALDAERAEYEAWKAEQGVKNGKGGK